MPDGDPYDLTTKIFEKYRKYFFVWNDMVKDELFHDIQSAIRDWGDRRHEDGYSVAQQEREGSSTPGQSLPE
jgi:hypothetical protein